MKQLTIILTLLLSFGFSQIMMPDATKMSNTEKMMLYQTEKKSPGLAVFYSLLLSSSGHAYSGNWKRGLKINAIKYSLGLAGTYSIFRWAPEEDYTFGALAVGFYLGTLGVFVYELIDVAVQAKNYNNTLYKQIFGKEPSWDISLGPQLNGIGLALSYNL